MDKKELQEILIKHVAWLTEEKGEERANLAGANLMNAVLTGVKGMKFTPRE